MEKWFINKYKLPPNHPLFVDQPIAIHLRSFYEDQLDEKDLIELRLKEEHIQITERTKLTSILREINDLFISESESKSVVGKDLLAEYWEKQMENGEEPNLDLKLEDLIKMGVT